MLKYRILKHLLLSVTTWALQGCKQGQDGVMAWTKGTSTFDGSETQNTYKQLCTELKK